MNPEQKFNEYVDSLVTCELAMLIAFKYKEPVNKTVAATAKRVSKRCLDKMTSRLFLGLSKDECPAASLYQMRSSFDELIG